MAKKIQSDTWSRVVASCTMTNLSASLSRYTTKRDTDFSGQMKRFSRSKICTRALPQLVGPCAQPGGICSVFVVLPRSGSVTQCTKSSKPGEEPQ